MISSAEDLGIRITDQLQEGNTSFSTYVNGLSEANLVGINHGLDGFSDMLHPIRFCGK